MQGPRIGDKGLGAKPPSGTPGESRLLTRLGAAVASPVGVLFLVPGLVFAIGAWLTLLGQQALEQSALALGLEQMHVRNAVVARQLGLALGQADPMLARLRGLAAVHDSGGALANAAFPLRDLLEGRPGVAYASLSFPDGTFQGAYVHEDGSIRFQDSRVETAGTRVRHFGTDDRAALVPLGEERTSYDPRARPFYALASASTGAAWTPPYPFFKTHFTGITRTEAVRSAGGRLRAVVTVDFDVNELSSYLERLPLAGSRVVLYTTDGSLLADPGSAARLRRLPVPADRTLRIADLGDPALDALVAAQERGDSSRFSAAGRRYLGDLASVGDPALGWRLASFVPEELLLAPARAYASRARLIALVSLLLAVGVAVLFSRHLVRMRRQTAEARAQATRAAAEARDLGSYRLTTRLGVGGMGEVWRAEHRLLAREAAIKLIRPEAGAGPDAQERFRREAQTLATLRSRNTIELFDYGITEDGTFFYVMELLEGMDLETLVARHGPLPPARVSALLLQACSSLAEAHASGLIHRDIKPANLYVCRAADEVDVLKVLDFGLVRSLADETAPAGARSLEDLARELEADTLPMTKLTAAGMVMGTPDFMAPEQALGVELDARADLYALGCVAYYALSGQVPFSRPTTTAILLAHLQEQAPPLAARARMALPPALAALIERCMAKRPEDRPASADALRRELSQLEFSEREAWTEERAADWWDDHVPRRVSVPASGGPLAPKRDATA